MYTTTCPTQCPPQNIYNFSYLLQTDAFVKRDVSSPPPDLIDAFKKNVDSLKNCIDKSLAQAVSNVNVEKKLQPVFDVVGDQLNRLSKAVILESY